METFSQRLAYLLDKCEQTQKSVADATNLSTSGLVKYKTDRIPKAEELFRLAKFFNVSMEWFLTGVEPNGSHGDTNVNFHNLVLKEDLAQYQAVRRIPVISWVQAGIANDFQEIPEDWQELVPTDCNDEKAFALLNSGESMLPKYSEGDTIIVMPSHRPYPGDLCVCRFAESARHTGVTFKRVEYSSNNIILIPENPRYPTTQHDEEDFEWIYPVWGVWNQVRK